MEMVIFLELFAIVPKIPGPKHHEIQVFAKNYHISAMKFSICTYSTAMLQVHYNISFEMISQRFNN
jgi:hypothetical protein